MKRVIVITAALCVGLAGACMGQVGSTLDGSGQGDTNGLGSGGAGQGQGGDKPLDLDPGEEGQGGFQECAEVSDEAKLIPVTMFIAVDKSGSMQENGKWQAAKNAFFAFFTSPDADGLNVALRFWPDGGCNWNTCDANACAQPQVDKGSLADPAHEQALMAEFNKKTPYGLTPMSAALQGATKWAVEQQIAAESKEKVVVVFLTDGIPTACDQNINNIASSAQWAYDQAEVLTFAVGLQGSQEQQMDIIAKAGHTEKGFFIGNGNAEQELLAALKKIQESVVACSFAMPESSDPTSPIDPKQVNVTYTPGGGGDDVVLKQVNGEAECTQAQGGWYYDDPKDPAVIILCDSTCAVLQADPDAKVKLVLGCGTIAE